MKYELTLWQKVELWAEDNELAFSLITYYFICALVGFIQGLALGRYMVSLLMRT